VDVAEEGEEWSIVECVLGRCSIWHTILRLYVNSYIA